MRIPSDFNKKKTVNGVKTAYGLDFLFLLFAEETALALVVIQ